TEIIKSDCAGGSGCQIDMSSADERASIIYPHDHAAVVVDLNLRSKRQCTMRRRHRRAIYMFAVRGKAPAAAIYSAVDAGDFSISAVRGETCYGTSRPQQQI